MYRFLDRPMAELDEPDRFLVAAFRIWTDAARGGRCPCAALLRGFATRGVMAALGDFSIAMAALDQQALTWLRFGRIGAPDTSEDEARVLALFAAARCGAAERVRRIAATLVADDAAATLAIAAEWVTHHFATPTILENDE